MGVDAWRRRLDPLLALNNLCSTATFLAVGGLIFRAAMADPHSAASAADTQTVTFALAIFGLFIFTNALNFALVAVQWAYYARTARSAALVERGKEYIEAARGLGLSRARVMLRHLLPNALPPLIVVRPE